jgi:hypothetical protein
MATKTTRKAAAAKPEKKRGNVTQEEITPLIIAARKAFDVQDYAGLVEFTGSTTKRFDAWRHRECKEAVGKDGITSCNHGDYKPLLSHFQKLAGDEAGAFKTLMKTGKPTDHAAPGDTHEDRRIIAHTIAKVLAAHIYLAETSREQLLAEAIGEHHQYQGDLPWDGSASASEFWKVLDRKAAIEGRGKGPVGVGYIVYITRQKTRRPDLTLRRDWQAGLAERCTVSQLTQIRYTLVNRIDAVEGVGTSVSRNKSQRSPKAAAARSPRTVAPRQHGVDFL